MIDKVNLEQAVSEINENASKNFKEALDVAVNLGIDPKKTDQAVRGATNLPHGNGKTYKVAVFAEGDEAKDALENGADKVGMEDLAEDIFLAVFENRIVTKIKIKIEKLDIIKKTESVGIEITKKRNG